MCGAAQPGSGVRSASAPMCSRALASTASITSSGSRPASASRRSGAQPSSSFSTRLRIPRIVVMWLSSDRDRPREMAVEHGAPVLHQRLGHLGAERLVEISEDLLQERQRLRAVLERPAAERGEERGGVHVEGAGLLTEKEAVTAGAGALELRLEQSEHLADAPADPARMAGRLAVARGEHPRDRQRKSARALRRDPRLDDGEPTAPTEPALPRDQSGRAS